MLSVAELEYSSLRKEVLNAIGNFLLMENFKMPNVGIVKDGILNIIDLISDYYEEGKPLFPEVIIVSDIEFLNSIIPKIITIKRQELTKEEFGMAIKLCAPLATSGWIIFIEVNGSEIRYGLVSADVDETSPSIHSQVVGDLKFGESEHSVAYIRNIGKKVVELSGIKNKVIVSLNLEPPGDYSKNELNKLCNAATKDCDADLVVKLNTYFEKLIDEALKLGHGNLIGIVRDTEENIAKVKRGLKVNGGIYLEIPIDFQNLLMQTQEGDSQASVNLRSHGTIFQAMLNHDGITIMTDKGKILGYHMLIADDVREGDKLTGGARSKAFISMTNCGHFDFCFYKSQDGNLKIWGKK